MDVKSATGAFQCPTIQDIWTEVVPHNADIALTHGPAQGHLGGSVLGSELLIREFWHVEAVACDVRASSLWVRQGGSML